MAEEELDKSGKANGISYVALADGISYEALKSHIQQARNHLEIGKIKGKPLIEEDEHL